MNPGELVHDVSDAESFLAFVEALKQDRLAESAEQSDGPEPPSCGEGSRGWCNHTIEEFLDAALAWARSTDVGATQGLSDECPWKRFAVFLYCGKIYE